MLKVEDSEVDRLLRIARRTRARILTSSSDENNSGNEQSSGLIKLLFILFFTYLSRNKCPKFIIH